MLKFSIKTKEQKSLEMKNILYTLEKGIKDVFNSDKYKKYLYFCSRFHNYSFNNIILILSQCPNAKKCASYATWTSLKMPVKKGEKGIKILFPVTFKYEEKTDDEEDEEPKVKTGIRYKIGHVFDISQVEGEMPELVNELELNPEYLESIIHELILNSSVPISYDVSLKKSDSNGYYDPSTDTIALRKGMSSLQTFKTLIHEKAHSTMHNKNCEDYSRSECEVQAESVAYIVSATIGLDTSEYSFGYIACWSEGKDLRELKNSLALIEKASKEITDWITSTANLKLTA